MQNCRNTGKKTKDLAGHRPAHLTAATFDIVLVFYGQLNMSKTSSELLKLQLPWRFQASLLPPQRMWGSQIRICIDNLQQSHCRLPQTMSPAVYLRPVQSKSLLSLPFPLHVLPFKIGLLTIKTLPKHTLISAKPSRIHQNAIHKLQTCAAIRSTRCTRCQP